MNMKPYGDLVLLKEQEQVKKSSTIIMLPGADGDYVYADNNGLLLSKLELNLA